MMKDKRPIQQQVAELTEEQKGNVVSVFKKNVWMMMPLYVLYILAVLITQVVQFQARDAYHAADDRRYEAREKYSYTVTIDGETMSLWDLDHPEVIEATRQAELAEQQADAWYAASLYVLAIGAVVLVGADVLVNAYAVKKCPYYSERRYFYIKKQQKVNGR